ncbi:MAG: mechanosensitive ion channel domain-containing protein [Pseudomonadota bacterium]
MSSIRCYSGALSEAPPEVPNDVLPELALVDAVVPVAQLQTFVEQALIWVRTELLTAEVAIQVALLAAVLVPAAVLGPRLRRTLSGRFRDRTSYELLARLLDTLGALATPLVLYLALMAARVAFGGTGQPTGWLDAAQALLSAWIVVRLVTLLIRSRFWSRVAFYVVWPIAALDVFGALEPVVTQMQQLAVPLGSNDAGKPIEISLLDVLRTGFYFLILFWLASLLNQFLAQQIRAVDDLNESLKALLIKLLNVVLPVVALLAALQIVGFNLATLAVFSGAVGLGIGLGLQRLLANFIAGYTLIADRSIKPGDVVEIDDTFGWVTAMQSRYVAIRTRDGTERLVPNDRFMAEGVINWSRSDRVVRLHAPFGVSYAKDDLRALQALAVEAARAVDRVVADPKPVCNLMGYGDSSVDFDLRFWITDPEAGMANVRSQVLLELWDRLKAAEIEIPFPQRDLHVRSWQAEAAPPTGASDQSDQSDRPA